MNSLPSFSILSTLISIKALSFVDNLTDESRITGIDLFPTFIDLFNTNAAKLNLQDRVKGVVASMDKLDFPNEELDLIWSEGAIYNIGFERGLKEWRRFLKEGAYLAVSEASWFTEKRPAEIETFWQDAYPFISRIAQEGCLQCFHQGPLSKSVHH